MKDFLLKLNDMTAKLRGKCVYCLRELPAGNHVCQKCGKKEAMLLRHSFHGNTLFTAEYDGAVRSLLHRYKFSGHPYFSVYIAKLMADTLSAVSVSFDVMTYVPVHEKKRRERGFDQSELLCLYLGEHIGVPAKRLLFRTRYTEPLFSLSADERKAEVKGAFELLEEDVSGRKILLVDDISTTGASMDECERILVKNGADVVRFAFAKGSR